MIEFTDTEYCRVEGCDNEVKDEGDSCHECQAQEAMWRRKWDFEGRREVQKAREYREDMINSGRARLLIHDESERWGKK